MNPDEEFEENYENISLEKEFASRLDSNQNDQKPKNLLLKESDNLLNCVNVDLIVKYYRLHIKSEFINKHKGLNADNNETVNSVNSKKSKISLSQTKKLDIIKGKTAVQVKNNMDFLKLSLQEAGKMEPDKPVYEKYEKEMILAIGKNLYLSSIFKLIMSIFRSGKQDQKYLLTECLETLKKAFNEENDRLRYFEENFLYIKAAEKIDKNKNLNHASFYPYNLLYKDIMIDNCEKIPQPILIHKTSQTSTFIFPLVKVKKNNLSDKYNFVKKVTLFGQISTGTNIVALHNKTLTGTGNMMSVFDYVTVRNLKINEKYIYAFGKSLINIRRI